MEAEMNEVQKPVRATQAGKNGGRIGRKPGSKNKPGHRAGGPRPGAGRPRKHPVPEPDDPDYPPRTPRSVRPVGPGTAAGGSDAASPNADLSVLPPDGLVDRSLDLLLDPALMQADAAMASAAASTSAAAAASPPKARPLAAEPAFTDDEDGFKADLWHIKKEMEVDGARGWPVCYQQGSLWHRHGRSPYLASHIVPPALLPSGSQPRERHDLFVWIPDLLVGRPLLCSCASSLSRHGWNEQPARMVCGLDRVYGLLTCRYQCTSTLAAGCPDGKVLSSGSGKKASRRTCQGWDELIINQLPPALQREFPGLLPWRVGVDKTALRLADALSAQNVNSTAVKAIFEHLFSDRLADDPLLSKMDSSTVNGMGVGLPQLTDGPPPPPTATTTTSDGEVPRFAGLKPSAAMRRGSLTISFERRARADGAEPGDGPQPEWIV